MSGYIGNIPVPQATQTRQSFTATASQTTFNTAGYSVGYVDVFLNGVKLAPADYTATNGSDIILAVGAASGDILEIVAYEIFQVVDQDFTGDFTVDGSTFVVDSTNNRVGIGTSSPATKLSLVSNGPGGDVHIKNGSGQNALLEIAGNNNTTGSTSALYGQDASGNAYAWQRANAPLLLGTNNTERMRITGTGHVLLGQSSTLLAGYGNTVTGFSIRNDGGFYASRLSGGTINANTNTDGEIAVFRKDGTQVGVIGTVSSELFIGTGSSGFYFDASNTSIKPRNVSSGTGSAADGTIDLGGTGNSYKDLYLSNAVRLGDAVLQEINGTDPFLSGNAYYNGSTWNYLTSTDAANYYQTGGQHIWRSAASGTAGNTISWSEAMRIDSSGNLLVDTTSTSIVGSGGFAAKPQGSGVRLDISNSGGAAMLLDRRTNDGDIISFYKDGTTVGSIGVTDGDNLVISSTATDHAGLKFNNTAMGAYVNGASSDGTMDIGTYVVRFKDLYLSGGVDLGGTGASNQLSDYEEGTWTPTFDGLTNTPAFHNHSGKYTKIGNLVILQYFCQVNTTTNPTFSDNNATLYISGVPFAASGSGYTGSQGSVNAQSWAWNGTNNNQNVTGQVAASVDGSKLFFNVSQSGGNRGDVRNVSVTSSGPIIEATVMYRTT